MVKTKNGIKQIVALVLIIALAVASLLLAIPKSSKNVYAAPPISAPINHSSGLYKAGEYLSAHNSGTHESVRLKTLDELVENGDITISGEPILGYTVTVNNKNLQGDLVIAETYLWYIDGLLEGCTGLTTVVLESSGGSCTNYSRLFYGCTSLKQVVVEGDCFSISSNCDTTDMFTGCSSLEKINIQYAGEKTFADLGLKFTSYSKSDGTTYSASDTIPSGTEITLSGYKGSTTPTTPSTGVATDMLGLVVTAVIVVAICYVASKKKKVQR